MNIEVRDYKDEDLESVNRILEESFNISKKSINNDCFREIVSTIDGKVCGYLLLTKVLNPVKDKYYFLVDYVCVDSKYRNLGLGKKMLSYAEEVACSYNAMYLQLTCSTFRIEAHKLYESCGYVKRNSDLFRKELN